MLKNYYAILGISSNATIHEIKKAYRINAIRFHPDKHFGDNSFSMKFVEIKEAYDVLINEEKRAEYDLEFGKFYQPGIKKEPSTQSKSSYKEKEEVNFNYQAYDKYFNDKDRNLNNTPPIQAEQTPWGESIRGKYVMFSLPTNIGRIISGWSTLLEGKVKLTNSQLFISIIKSSLISIVVFAVIFLLIWKHWYFNLHDLNSSRNLSIAYIIIISIILGVKYILRSNDTAFKHMNCFIGVNGFAIHLAVGQKNEVYGKLDVNFHDVTDFISSIVVNNLNFQYSSTKYEFIWINASIEKPLFKISGSHNYKDGNPDKLLHSDYWLNIEAEKLWTIYLLDIMENTLESKGYIEFNIYSFEHSKLIPYIKIGIGFITFLTGGQTITYNFNDIKRIYTKGTDLFIEHKNYEKSFFFFESGDKNYIPLLNLSNRKYFMKAIEILLGYEIL
ncbi:MAG TPA: DnaJ domain-containing protein [Candidatus Paceibacterota bacterium]